MSKETNNDWPKIGTIPETNFNELYPAVLILKKPKETSLTDAHIALIDKKDQKNEEITESEK